jgi:hypothetical protein
MRGKARHDEREERGDEPSRCVLFDRVFHAFVEPTTAPRDSESRLAGPLRAAVHLWQQHATHGQRDAGAADRSTLSPFAPGQTITLQWTETVSHAGWFRIAIATDRSKFVDPPRGRFLHKPREETALTP